MFWWAMGEMVCRSLGTSQPHSTPSMMRDLAAGKPSELDYQVCTTTTWTPAYA